MTALTDRLDAYLADRGLEAVWFARPNSFAWLTAGGDNVVDRRTDVGEAAVGYDGEGLTVASNNIETPRIRDEELPADLPVAFESGEWYDESLADVVASVSPTPAAADFDVPGLGAIEDASALRQPLTDDQIAAYDAFAGEAAAALEDVLRDANAGDTEQSVAAEIRGAIEALGASTPVVLVGGGERAQRYRHFTPTGAELGEYALAAVTVERDGQFVSCTRTVAFDPPAWLGERTRAAMHVEAAALGATQQVGREGGTAGAVFDAIRDAYDAVGWPGEWRHHHQGGAAGYNGREWIATPGHGAPVELPMAYSWNPTVQGAKSEDLHLVTEDRIEPLTATGAWPTRTVTAPGDGPTLERHDVLEL
ncbi:MAG: M24 family metallopeptidase [Haloarculaceae archaeon]